jgi:hypothetical protein
VCTSTLVPMEARVQTLSFSTLSLSSPCATLCRELGILTLEQALARNLKADQMNYAEIMLVLRQLIYHAGRREESWPHFQTALRLLGGFSDVLRCADGTSFALL